MASINDFPIQTTSAEGYILQVLSDNGFESDGEGSGGGSGLTNMGAIATEQRASSAVVQSGDSLDITPTSFDVNNFGQLLGLQTESNGLVFKTTNADRLNLQIRISVPLEDTQGTEETHLVYLQRGNESTSIETTVASVKGRRFAQTTDAGLVLTYSSGPSDPFNNAGFRVIFQNDGLFPITVRDAEVRVDFFAVADPNDTSAG